MATKHNTTYLVLILAEDQGNQNEAFCYASKRHKTKPDLWWLEQTQYLANQRGQRIVVREEVTTFDPDARPMMSTDSRVIFE